VNRGETRVTVKLDIYCPLAHMCRIVVEASESKGGSSDRNTTKMPRGQKRQYPKHFHHGRETVHGG